MKCRKLIRNDRGGFRFIEYHRCDTCNQICENDDYLGDDEDTMCIPCWNRLKKMEEATGTAHADRP